ncbi:hypothetical protein SLA2020_399740 [Shorea laevis]
MSTKQVTQEHFQSIAPLGSRQSAVKSSPCLEKHKGGYFLFDPTLLYRCGLLGFLFIRGKRVMLPRYFEVVSVGSSILIS